MVTPNNQPTGFMSKTQGTSPELNTSRVSHFTPGVSRCILFGFLALLTILWFWPSFAHADGPIHLVLGWFSEDVNNNATSMAWGDVDGDGDFDLAVGAGENEPGPNKVYLNESGVLHDTPNWTSDDADNTFSVALGDVDGDGDLDLAAGNGDGPNKVYLNQGGILSVTAEWISGDTDNTRSVPGGT